MYLCRPLGKQENDQRPFETLICIDDILVVYHQHRINSIGQIQDPFGRSAQWVVVYAVLHHV